MLRAATVLVLFAVVVASAAASPTARRPAPLLAGQTIDGKRASLAQLRGKPVFVNVWSSW